MAERMKTSRLIILTISLLLLTISCRHNDARTDGPQGIEPAILTLPTANGFMFPDYGDSIVLPPNIAPLNFSVNGKIRLRVNCGETELLDKNYRGQVRFKLKTWRRWLNTARERQQPLRLEIGTAERAYAPLHWFVANDTIDPYLVYRLVVPTDGVYNILGIYQRDLSNFSTTALTLNSVSENNCMNCHTFRNGDAAEMTVHWRKPSEGTLIRNGEGDTKIVLPSNAGDFNLRLTYPAYHPQGRYIAFSTNLLLGYGCYEAHRRFFDPGDSIAHIVVYDIQTNHLFSDRLLWQEERLLSYPAWSPDGRTLYFCSAPAPGNAADSLSEKQKIESIRFSVACIGFDPETGRFGDSVQTLLAADDYNGSFSLPRVNPADPNCMAVSIGTFSSFPSQTYGDLGLVFLNRSFSKHGFAPQDTLTYSPVYEPATALNTPEAESYHSWSRNGRWIVYTGKQMDGYFALPYIAYFDGKTFSKPFLLPQKAGDWYRSSLKSYNLPELTVSPSTLTPEKTEKLRREGYTLVVDIHDIETLINNLHESEAL